MKWNGYNNHTSIYPPLRGEVPFLVVSIGKEKGTYTKTDTVLFFLKLASAIIYSRE